MTSIASAVEHLDYVISTKEVLWGVALIAVTMIMHAYGMVMTLQLCQKMRQRTGPQGGFLASVRILVLASWLIVSTHLIEVVVWGVFFTWCGALPTLSIANYYALLQYTTVGSEVSLPYAWRLLAGMLPMAGMLTFAWSTTVLLGLALQVQDQQLHRMSRPEGPDKP